ncbi:MAG: DUF547 domain-containing protein [Candidatus Dadabacteria bacterium]|nr:DUF547 domain-containing protein [Candidatus Dadabacteria bacterium]MDE0663586.1 DUF547 domain-containing protein [Candidatus Dadabacteria bacterium]
MKTNGAARHLKAAVLFLLVSVISPASFPNISPASAKTVQISFWDRENEANTEKIDHVSWQQILNAYLEVDPSGVSKFDYASLKADAGDRAKLAEYLGYLHRIDPRDYSKAEQKAYWINFYNSLTVKLVVDAYPVKSILEICRDRVSGSQCSGPWKETHAKVAGQNLTLDNIENGILRPIWKDNLIHYGLSCASYGCPSLLKTAFSAKNTEGLLAAAAREYVNHPRGVSFIENDLIIISSIYKWYSEDFGKNEQDIIRHLQSYADKKLTERLKNFKGSIDYEYDWSLNCP